jgi:hypothetical protein
MSAVSNGSTSDNSWQIFPHLLPMVSLLSANPRLHQGLAITRHTKEDREWTIKYASPGLESQGKLFHFDPRRKPTIQLDRRDQAHRMPVITPAYPSMCSTHNISASTMSIVRNEMMRAMRITDRILSTPGSSWMELFERVEFFSLYKTYVQVVASASTSEAIKDW